MVGSAVAVVRSVKRRRSTVDSSEAGEVFGSVEVVVTASEAVGIDKTFVDNAVEHLETSRPVAARAPAPKKQRSHSQRPPLSLLDWWRVREMMTAARKSQYSTPPMTGLQMLRALRESSVSSSGDKQPAIVLS